jgi:hypothetical protein
LPRYDCSIGLEEFTGIGIDEGFPFTTDVSGTVDPPLADSKSSSADFDRWSDCGLNVGFVAKSLPLSDLRIVIAVTVAVVVFVIEGIFVGE